MVNSRENEDSPRIDRNGDSTHQELRFTIGIMEEDTMG
jgi:hypothetical protein